jgi:hypothetical protein
MTATMPELDRGPLYPVTPGFPRCAACYQRTPDLATSVDPRTDELAPLCGPCRKALFTGQPLTLPTGQALLDTWEWLAHAYQNGEFTEIETGQALDTLAPHLNYHERDAAFEQYREALLDLQDVRDPNADPRGWDIPLDLAEEMADDDRMDALRKLTGSQS